MNWYRVAAASTLPIVMVGPIVAICFYKQRMLAGVILGSGIFFMGFVLFAAWEFAEALNSAVSRTAPSIFTKIVTYGFVAMVQVMALFLVNDGVEKRIRDRDSDPVWR